MFNKRSIAMFCPHGGAVNTL